MSAPTPPSGLRKMLMVVGPGIVVAATGVGAGDMVAAAKAGATYGLVVLWAALAGAVLKLVLAEGVARWQLATGTTLLEGWFSSFGWPVKLYVAAYTLVWTVVVSAALMSACGLAAHALVPILSVKAWAALHGIAALVLVWCEGYPVIERLMAWAVGLMFVAIVGTATLQRPDLGALVQGLLVPAVPPGGGVLVAGVIGGVGGTLTLLSYGYWLQEKGWRGAQWLPAARVDLAVGYVLTGVFGLAVVLLGGSVLFAKGLTVQGASGVVQMAAMLGDSLGRVGTLVFLVGFWGAVATSIVGVWQGVPYLFAHAIALQRGQGGTELSTRSRHYRGYLLFMTFPPMLLLLVDRPVWLVVTYAAVGSLFMPFLAITLLLLNNRADRLGPARNGVLVNLMLVVCVILFVYLAVAEILAKFG